jgi:hypothetical protein
MKAQISNATLPNCPPETPRVTADLFLEIEPQGQENSFRLPVYVKDLAAEGVILEVADLPPGLKGESLLHQAGILLIVPDGLTKETQLRSKVVWIRQGDRGSSHYLLGLDLGEADLRSRRCLENLRARPKDISDLWTYWDQVQIKPEPAAHNGRIILYVGGGAFLGGLALKVALPDSDNIPAMVLTLLGLYMIAGTCLWNWWRRRSLPKES